MKPTSENPGMQARDWLQIAIDGPAGSGKSTIGERVARALGYVYIDTGAFYRALTALAQREHINPEDAAALAALAARTPIRIVNPTTVDLAEGRQYTVLAGGENVTRALRTPAVEGAVSAVSHHMAVREIMRERQRESADQLPVVMVGRDIGTVVLPHADLKIYLTTSLDERARRRHADLVANLGPEAPTFEQVRDEIHARDEGDANQLRVAADAVVIDNDDLLPEETVARILALVEQRLRERADYAATQARPGPGGGAS